jgi:hypothetical protein
MRTLSSFTWTSQLVRQDTPNQGSLSNGRGHLTADGDPTNNPPRIGGFRKWRLRRRNEGGATIVEFAIVLPLLILLMVGIMEIGLAFYDYLTIERATLEGVRTAAFTGTSRDADCAAVRNVVAAFPDGFVDRIDRIEIYKADANGDQLPGFTNIWRYNGGGPPRDCVTSWNVTELWPATSRQTVAGTSPGFPPLDIIGVRIRLDRRWITNFPPFTGTYRIDEHSILRMEPEVYE